MSKPGLFGRVLGTVAREIIAEYSKSNDDRRGEAEELDRKIDRKRKRLAEALGAFGQSVQAYGDRERREAAEERDQQELEERSGGGPYPFDFLMERHATTAIALVRPYPPHREPHGRSHVGGLPSLPGNLAWPRARDGHPLHFLAQVDCAELPRLGGGSGHRLPSEGTLLFFIRRDEYLELDGPDAVRVIFDPASIGRPAEPPADLPPIDKEWQRNFAAPGEMASATLPLWPLQPAAIRSMPDARAFDINAHSNPRFEDYIPRLRQFRTDEIERATGLPPAEASDPHWPDLTIFEPRRHGEPVRLRPFARTAFPWAARGIALIARRLLRQCVRPPLAHFAAELAEWREQADARPAAEPVTPEEAEAFIARLNAIMLADIRSYEDKEGVRREYHQTEVKAAVETAVHRLITETGADPALAALLPNALYARAYPRHAAIVQRNKGQKVRHAQMLGYMPSSQEPLPVGARTLTLLQLPSDPGISMIIGDMGELDFHIEPEALAAQAWERVTVRYFGG